MILDGRVAIVTGAGSGIGRASAAILAREGARVIVADRDGERAATAAEAIGERAEAVAADMDRDDDVARLVDHAAGRHGRLDIVHSHAGIQVEGGIEEAEAAGMDASWRLNVRAHFVLIRRAMPHLRRAGKGSVIVTASNSGVFHDPGMVAYCTSKHAAVAMARQIALDYARHNVRVNALCPGWVDTPFNEPFMRQMGGRAALERYVRDKIPMARWAAPEEIAEAVLFLASDRSSFMTGQALVVDGGECLA